MALVFPDSHAIIPVDEGGQQRGLLPGALVVAPEQLGQLLVEVEDDVGVPVFARHRVRPQLLHEEHLVRELGGGSWSKEEGCKIATCLKKQ